MILYAMIAVITIGIAFMVRPEDKPLGASITRQGAINRICMIAIFVILFALSALRLDVGNDYGDYSDTFHEIYVGGDVVTELGFNLVVRLLYWMVGGECYILVFAVFAFLTTVLFLKAIYDQSVDFKWSFFLFMTLGIYFRTFNTVRYYFVLAITLFAMRYLLRSQYGKFIITILFAALFHKSVLVVIPLYLLADRVWKKWQLLVMGLLCASIPLFQDFYLQLALKLYPSYVNTVFLETGTGITSNLFGIARCALVLVLALACYEDSVRDNRTIRFYFNLNIMTIILYLCFSFLPLLSRFGYYLMTSHILYIPAILQSISNEKKKKVLTYLVAGIAVLYFIVFLVTATQVGVKVLPYHSWLFYEKEWLNGSDIF